MVEISWTNLLSKASGEKADAFLKSVDIGAIIFDSDPKYLRTVLFGCLKKYQNFPNVQSRTFQLLQDCHLLSPPGITEEELSSHFSLILATMERWITKTDVIKHCCELLSMLGTLPTMHERGCLTTSGELVSFLKEAIPLHHHSKPLQRAILLLLETICENSDEQNLSEIANAIFQPVLDDFLLHSDDNVISSTSIAIICILFDHSISAIIQWRDQIVTNTMSTIERKFSVESICKSLLLVKKLFSQELIKNSLIHFPKFVHIIAHTISLFQERHQDVIIIVLELLTAILSDYDTFRICFVALNEEQSLVELGVFRRQLLDELQLKFKFNSSDERDAQFNPDISSSYTHLVSAFDKLLPPTTTILTQDEPEFDETNIKFVNALPAVPNAANEIDAMKSEIDECVDLEGMENERFSPDPIISEEGEDEESKSNVYEHKENEMFSPEPNASEEDESELPTFDPEESRFSINLHDIQDYESAEEDISGNQETKNNENTPFNNIFQKTKSAKDIAFEFDEVYPEISQEFIPTVEVSSTQRVESRHLSELQSALLIAQKQAADAIRKAETMHSLFQNAAEKIEILIEENLSLREKISFLSQQLERKDSEASLPNVCTESERFFSDKEIQTIDLFDSLHASSSCETKFSEHFDNQIPAIEKSNPLTENELFEPDNTFEQQHSGSSPITVKKIGFSGTQQKSKSGRKQKISKSITVERDSESNPALSGILSALERIFSCDPQKTKSDDNSEPIHELSDLITELFLRVVETYTHSRTRVQLISIRRFKLILAEMKLIDGKIFSMKNADILFNQFRAKNVTLFGTSFSLLLCAEKRFPGMNREDFLDILISALKEYMESLNKRAIAIQPNEIDLEHFRFESQTEVEEILKLLEYNRKSLTLLFESYSSFQPTKSVPLFTEGANLSKSTNTESSCISPIKMDDVLVDSSPVHSEQVFSPPSTAVDFTQVLGDWIDEKFKDSAFKNRTMFLSDFLAFAKDFQIYPSFYSRCQLLEMFKSIFATVVTQHFSKLANLSATGLHYEKFVFLLVHLGIRGSSFRGTSSPILKMENFFHLLNVSSGKTLIMGKRVTEVFYFRTFPRSAKQENKSAFDPSLSFASASPKRKSILDQQKLPPESFPYYDVNTQSIVQMRRKKNIEELRSLIVSPQN